MQRLLVSYLLGLLRYLLSGVFLWMVERGISTPEQNEQLLVGVAGAIGMAIWLWYVKKRDKSEVLTALSLPRNSTPRELQAEMKASGGVTPKVLGVALAVVVGASALSGCASIPRIAPLPVEVAQADQHVKAVTGNVLQLLTMSAAVVNTVSKLEDDAAKSGLVPAPVDAKFDAAMVAYADASDAAVKGLTSGALTTWPQLRLAVEPVLAKGQSLIETATQIGAIKTKAASFLTQLRDLLSAAVGEFMFGGAR